jgi:hypothetical protein
MNEECPPFCHRGRMVSKPKGQQTNALGTFDTILPPANNLCVPREAPPRKSSSLTQIRCPAFALLGHEKVPSGKRGGQFRASPLLPWTLATAVRGGERRVGRRERRLPPSTVAKSPSCAIRGRVSAFLLPSPRWVLRRVSVHGSRVTSVQRDIESRTRRGQGFAVEWPKDGGRSHQEAGAAFKWRIPALISSQTRATIPARGTMCPLRNCGGFPGGNHFRNSRPEEGRLRAARGPDPAILRSRSSLSESGLGLALYGCHPRSVNGYSVESLLFSASGGC